MEIKPGSRWKSQVCSAELVVVRPPSAPGTLQCGGHPVIALTAAAPEGLALDADHSDGVLVGKRYVDPVSGIEVLGSKAGAGSASFDGRALVRKDAKPLPASD